MARWTDVEHDAPDLAARARAFLDAHVHKTMATLRRDGAPRISGTETYLHDGDLWMGSMWGARKAQDLQRDGRIAIHSGSVDPPAWTGDAKVGGRAVEITDPVHHAAVMTAITEGREIPDDPAHLFRIDIDEVVVTTIGDPADHLVIELWRPGHGVKRMQR